ncbi:MAG: serine/threonine protein phosphatase [Rhodobacterales bacterium]|nr:MAG: serine/threonine protein phosphatase [Rhodobacterales bacterium]
MRSTRGKAERRLILREVPPHFYAVGDVHGCFDLYLALERFIAARLSEAKAPGLLVLLGDVIDRGPQSAQVLAHLLEPAPAGLTRVLLRGNHEQMMLDFMAAPRAAREWLDHGGIETLQSYGATVGAGRLGEVAKRVIPATHLAFLRQTPLCLTAGHWLLAHAGVDPDKSLEAQEADDFLWSDPRDLDHRPMPGYCVVHGHKPEETPTVAAHRIGLDTGAKATGRLSAVRLGAQRAEELLVARRAGGAVSVDLTALV